MQKRHWIPMALLTLALAAAAGFGAVQSSRAAKMEARLQEVYDGALLSALRQMEDMQLMLSKALLSADPGESMQYLSQASGGAAQVQRSLSLLPLSHTATQNAVKFANQLSDYILSKESSRSSLVRRPPVTKLSLTVIIASALAP